MNTPQQFGDYELLEVIGGGMGIVYRARRRGEGRDLAIKVLRHERLLDGEARARFTRELAAMQSVRHPAVCPVLDAGEVDGVPFLCMPYLAGRSLAAVVADTLDGGRPVPWQQAVEWMANIAEAVQAAHDRGLVHRDIKPSNILVDEAGNPHLLDFGLARFDTDRRRQLTRTGQVVGTPAYLSPEQIHARRSSVDGRADVYGLGATLFELLAGRPPFLADTRAELYELILDGPLPDLGAHRPDLARAVVEVVSVAMSRQPGHRQPTAGDLAADLRRAARGQAPRWRRQPWLLRCRAAVRRNAAPVSWAGATVVLGALLAHSLAEQRVLAQVRELASSGKEIARSREQLLLADFAALPPPFPEHATRLRDWLARAQDRSGKPAFDAASLGVANPAVRDRILQEHALARAIAAVEQRLEAAESARNLAVAHGAAWQRAVAAVAADARFPGRIAVQHGLVPLGEDPDSGLQLFLHLASHDPAVALPERDAAGRLQLPAGHGIVFVLVPGGVVPAPSGGRTVSLAPFLIAKHELTRHQHRRLDGGHDPSEWPLVRVPNGELQTLQHPVDNVRFAEVHRLLLGWGLDLPTDLQFEWVARGAVGQLPREVEAGAGNFRGAEDGFHLNAPVGSFPCGPCGLHDLFGNVGELVRDEFELFDLPPRDGDGLRSVGREAASRTIRGGWHFGTPWPLGLRRSLLPDQRLPQVGLRPVRPLEAS